MPRRTAADRQLADLVDDVRACRACTLSPLPIPVEPNPVVRVRRTARLAICGQAPGTLAHASGAPFTDPSGVRLRDWMGIGPDIFYDASRIAIIPMGFCFPGQDAKGGDLPPRKECAPLWRERLLAHLGDLELILLVGGYAQKWHLGSSIEKNLTATVRNWRSYLDENASGDGRRYLPLPHPSWRNNGWLKKNPWFSEEVLPQLRQDVARLTR